MTHSLTLNEAARIIARGQLGLNVYADLREALRDLESGQPACTAGSTMLDCAYVRGYRIVAGQKLPASWPIHSQDRVSLGASSDQIEHFLALGAVFAALTLNVTLVATLLEMLFDPQPPNNNDVIREIMFGPRPIAT
ncbi:MAG TPA: hypothetical protein VGH44_00930 [Candidatus Saccharimonadia bacterium]